MSQVAIEFKAELTPVTAAPAWQVLVTVGKPSLLIAPRVSPRTQRYLREREINFFDLTGNAFWRLDSPGLFICLTADSDASKAQPFVRRRKLGGKKAGRLLRHICDTKPPYSVSELASTLTIDPGNVSRYLDLLHNERLVERKARGVVTHVDWEGVLRRWSEDYKRPAEHRFHDPRGAEHFLKSLKSAKSRYVLSGVVAAGSYAPHTVANSALCYCEDVGAFGAAFGLQRSDRNSNVTLAAPFDEIVYARTQTRDGRVVAAPTQVVIDLLIGRGRELSQAEELIRWMRDMEEAWRG